MEPNQPIKHILVGHDFDECSDAALAYATDLARPSGARVTVLHVYDTHSLGAPEVLVLATDYIKQIGAAAREKVEAVVARARDSRITVEGEVREGAPWRELDAFAKERKVDLIVVGSHGRRWLPRALLGSVAEKVVRTAPCPVLVVRREGAES